MTTCWRTLLDGRYRYLLWPEPILTNGNHISGTDLYGRVHLRRQPQRRVIITNDVRTPFHGFDPMGLPVTGKKTTAMTAPSCCNRDRNGVGGWQATTMMYIAVAADQSGLVILLPTPTVQSSIRDGPVTSGHIKRQILFLHSSAWLKGSRVRVYAKIVPSLIALGLLIYNYCCDAASESAQTNRI